jgi:hypothetical protein
MRNLLASKARRILKKNTLFFIFFVHDEVDFLEKKYDFLLSVYGAKVYFYAIKIVLF